MTETYAIAVCEDDRCPWKHRGVTHAATYTAAALHIDQTSHTVVVDIRPSTYEVRACPCGAEASCICGFEEGTRA